MTTRENQAWSTISGAAVIGALGLALPLPVM
jgi:hypothetical protein